MIPFVVALGVLGMFLVAAMVGLIVAAVRVRPWWGLVVLVPFGPVVFAVRHWPQARAPFLTLVLCGGLLGGLMAWQPELTARLRQPYTTFDPSPTPFPVAPEPHEVHDLAENEAPAAAAIDINATARAAYAKHHAELTALYNQLGTARAHLKPGKATAEFNAKATRYQESLRALSDEKTRLDALDTEGEAAAAFDRLRLLAGAEDYPGFAAQLRVCLADYRQSRAFLQTVALGRQTLSQATPERLAAWAGRHTAAETETVTRQIRAIVNQTPPVVPKLLPGKTIYETDYHPGATKPDFDTANLLSTRQPQQGDYVYITHVPGVYYQAAECEFNPQTKYFFTSRDVPKKKLSDAEYAELTRLYRILGRNEKFAATPEQRLADAKGLAEELAALNSQLTALASR